MRIPAEFPGAPPVLFSHVTCANFHPGIPAIGRTQLNLNIYIYQCYNNYNSKRSVRLEYG